MESKLDSIWQLHKASVRRILDQLTRDRDLTDDLLQETYLRAWRGISNYRDGDARAWLSEIARNVFYTYVRHARVKAEVQVDSDTCTGGVGQVGSEDHIEQLDIRNVLSKLPDDLRTALVMKHHVGLTYLEIARRTDCAPITARTRVHRAISLIRSTLDQSWRPTGPICSGMSTSRILDYLYQLLRPENIELVVEHLRKCDQCRERVDEIHALMRAMDGLPSGYKQMQFLDIDGSGVPSLHVASCERNISDEPVDTISFRGRIGLPFRSVAVPGARLNYDAAPSVDRSDLLQYNARLPYALAPGEDIRWMTSVGPLRASRATQVGCRTYRLDWNQLPSDTDRCAYTQVIRLPIGARLLFEQSGACGSCRYHTYLAFHSHACGALP